LIRCSILKLSQISGNVPCPLDEGMLVQATLSLFGKEIGREYSDSALEEESARIEKKVNTSNRRLQKLVRPSG
jgi:hypothetical protein